MKKFYFMAFIATAALTMTSCSNDDIAGTGSEISKNEAAQAINFSTYLGRAPQSRGVITDDDAIKKADKGFGVLASLTTNAGWSAEDTPNFMYNEQVTYSNNWTYSPVKYWPTNDQKISFFAYAPYKTEDNKIELSENTAKGAPTATITLQEPGNMVDFVAASAMNQTYTSNATTNGLVNFSLKHEMTRIALKATTSVADGTTVTINSITLGGTKLYDKGTYTFPTSDNTRGVWTLSSTKDITVTPLKETDLTNENTIDLFDGYLFLLPVSESLSTKEVTATIQYTVKTEDTKLTGNSISFTASKTVDLTALAQGISYIYTFNIGLNEIKLSAEVDSWGNDTPESVSVPAQDSDATTE